jgi:hypothetical protein
MVDLREGNAEADDPDEGMKWDERRRVRAEVLRALLLGAVRPVAGSVPKLQLAGALIEGILDVHGGNIECAAALTNCYFTDELQLADALSYYRPFWIHAKCTRRYVRKNRW